jgi:hypothetical protein
MIKTLGILEAGDTLFHGQRHLISFASTQDATGSARMEDGIRKTVAAEQTVDSADSASR